MFDAVDAGPDTGSNSAVPHRMCGYSNAGPVSLVGYRRELLVGLLLGAGSRAV